MVTTPGQFRAHLLASDAEFQRLVIEHSQYEAQLEELANSVYRSSEDLIREITLKKMKLRVKDAIEQRLADFQKRNGGS